ncbi:MAG: hypothetical protein HY851_10000 [candidate division Zixibacteria bacterium]|nr:hypothetical protein [candidate division Zixibacteria bacterium]
MESFVWVVGPIAIALFGFVVFWGIAKAVSDREDDEAEKKENQVDGHEIEP